MAEEDKKPKQTTQTQSQEPDLTSWDTEVPRTLMKKGADLKDMETK